MTKTELLKQIQPGDEVYFEFKGHLYISDWYEYIGLSECFENCANDCPGNTEFKGLNSGCLVFRGTGMPVTDIRKKNILPEELFIIDI